LKTLSLIFVFIIASYTSNSLAIDKKHYDDILIIKEMFKSQDKEALSSLVSYPLHRSYPIPAIKDKTEFIARFDEIFDQQFVELISNSNLDNDWNEMGWRGIMFSNGKLWLDTDYTIRAINYQSSLEKKLVQSLINNQKQSLHVSIRNFEKSILDWKTAKFRIRIDDLGNNGYRYSSWNIKKATTDKPDLVLFDGQLTFDGSGGNHQYTFKNGKYRYICHVGLLGNSNSPPGTLQVYRNDEQLLFDDVIEIF